MKRPVTVDPFFTDQPEKAFLGELTAPLHARKPSFFHDREPEKESAAMAQAEAFSRHFIRVYGEKTT